MQEVISGEVPFPDVNSDVAVMGRVLFQKELPERPTNCIPTKSKHGNDLWELLTQCWSHDPCGRPRAFQVKKQASVTR
jgi:hypothetical protein